MNPLKRTTHVDARRTGLKEAQRQTDKYTKALSQTDRMTIAALTMDYERTRVPTGDIISPMMWNYAISYAYKTELGKIHTNFINSGELLMNFVDENPSNVDEIFIMKLLNML